MEVNVTRIHEDFTEAKDDFRDGFRPWCEKEVDVMMLCEKKKKPGRFTSAMIVFKTESIFV